MALTPVLVDFVWERHHSRALVVFIFLDLTIVFFRFLFTDLFGASFFWGPCYLGRALGALTSLHWVFLVCAALASSPWQHPAWVYPALLIGVVYASMQSALELPACSALDVGGLDTYDRALATMYARPVYFLRVATVLADWGAVLCLLWQAGTAPCAAAAGGAEARALAQPLRGGAAEGGTLPARGGGGALQRVTAALRGAPLRHLAAVCSSILTACTLSNLATGAAEVLNAEGGNAEFLSPLSKALWVGASLACALVVASLLHSVGRAAGDAADLAAQQAEGGGAPAAAAPPLRHQLHALGLLPVRRKDSPFVAPQAWPAEQAWAGALDCTHFFVEDAWMFVFIMVANTAAVYLISVGFFSAFVVLFLLPMLRGWVVNLLISCVVAWVLRFLVRCAFACPCCRVVQRREGGRQELLQPRAFLLLDAVFSVVMGALVGSFVGFSRVALSFVVSLFEASQICRPVTPLAWARFDTAFSAYGAVQILALHRDGACDAPREAESNAEAAGKRGGVKFLHSYQTA